MGELRPEADVEVLDGTRLVAEGELVVIDQRVHIGGLMLAELVDALPGGRYQAPARVVFGRVKVTIEVVR